MRIMVQGFEWELGNLDLASFHRYLADEGGEEFTASGQKRLLFATHSKPYYCGLLITKSDRQTSLELVNEGGAYQVRLRRDDGNAESMEFNSYIIHEITKRGLYLTYRSSCSLRVFGYVMRRLYNNASGDQRDIELGELSELEDEQAHWKQKQEVRKKYKTGQFKCLPLLDNPQLQTMLQQLKRIRGFEWAYANAVVREPLFKPVKNFVSTERGALRFSVTTTNPGKIRKAILDFIAKYSPKSGKIVGEDASGNEETLVLTIKPQVFAELDFDEIMHDGVMDLTKVDQSPLFEDLKRVAAKHRRTFEG